MWCRWNKVLILGIAIITTSVARADLVGYWPMDENKEHKVIDKSGNKNGGIITGAEWVEGKKGFALQFSDENSSVEIADSEELDGMEKLTLEAWIKVLDGGGTKERRLASKSSCYGLYLNPNNTVTAFIRTEGYARVVTKEKISFNEWTHVAVVYDGSEFRVYINGIQKAKCEQKGSINDNSDPLIFSYSHENNFFNGIIDEVKLWDEVRTSFKEKPVTVDF